MEPAAFTIFALWKDAKRLKKIVPLLEPAVQESIERVSKENEGQNAAALELKLEKTILAESAEGRLRGRERFGEGWEELPDELRAFLLQLGASA